LRDTLERALARTPRTDVVFACAPARLAPRPGCATLEVECVAMVPPSLVEYALRAGASGVVVAGCREGDCEYRLGDGWMRARIARVRAPALRRAARDERVRLVFHGSDAAALDAAIDELGSSREIPHA
jgi:coenzyme F420-reducing hydrogenase delta subunit